MINIPKVEDHIVTCIKVHRVLLDRLVNPPVEKTYMTGEQRNAFYRKLIRQTKRELRQVRRVLNP